MIHGALLVHTFPLSRLVSLWLTLDGSWNRTRTEPINSFACNIHILPIAPHDMIVLVLHSAGLRMNTVLLLILLMLPEVYNLDIRCCDEYIVSNVSHSTCDRWMGRWKQCIAPDYSEDGEVERWRGGATVNKRLVVATLRQSSLEANKFLMKKLGREREPKLDVQILLPPAHHIRTTTNLHRPEGNV